MKEYIVPVAEYWNDYDEFFVGNIREGIELIRCKDCKFFTKDIGCVCMAGMVFAKEDDFCSRAERLGAY